LWPTVCYEDLFGAEMLAGASTSTLLLNLSNTAWFGHSLAQPQHLQIARMRTLETGRPMVRATNTGMTAAIAADGQVMAVLPPFTAGALTVTVQGMRGLTPYMRVGDWGALLLAVAACLPALRQRRHVAKSTTTAKPPLS
jgi:apolipoprotein N-acyltransferase